MGTHATKPINKYRTFDSEQVDQIVEVLSLDNADLFEAGSAIVPERKRLLLDPAKPAGKTRKIKRVLFSRVHESRAARRWICVLHDPWELEPRSGFGLQIFFGRSWCKGE